MLQVDVLECSRGEHRAGGGPQLFSKGFGRRLAATPEYDLHLCSDATILRQEGLDQDQGTCGPHPSAGSVQVGLLPLLLLPL